MRLDGPEAAVFHPSFVQDLRRPLPQREMGDGCIVLPGVLWLGVARVLLAMLLKMFGYILWLSKIAMEIPA